MVGKVVWLMQTKEAGKKNINRQERWEMDACEQMRGEEEIGRR